MTLRAIVLDAILWPTMQLGLAKLFVSLPGKWFEQAGGGIPAKGELKVYRRVLRIRRWKRLLPDGEGWVGGGFSKRSLASSDRAHLQRFVLETRRGEATHWAAIACSLIFFAWNPRFTWPGLFLLALALNAPCIVVQRYNRAALLRWLGRR